MPSKTLLIFNPMANLGAARRLVAVLQPLVDQVPKSEWVDTRRPAHASFLAQQAGADGYERVVAIGGDGTVHEVVNGLMQLPTASRPVLGVVPAGSGNDFAHSLGLPVDPAQALKQALAGNPQPVDLGRVQDGDRSEFFVNALGMGFDTNVVIHSRRIRGFKGFALYLIAVLKTIFLSFRPFHLQVLTDREEWAEDLLMLVLCNGKREGGGFLVAPHARTDDGLLHYVGVRLISRLKMLASIPPFLKGTHARLGYVRLGEFTRLDLQSNRPLQIHTDGEIFAGFASQTTRLAVEVLPGALKAVYG